MDNKSIKIYNDYIPCLEPKNFEPNKKGEWLTFKKAIKARNIYFKALYKLINSI